MHPNNSTAFHAYIQKNTPLETLFHSFHGFHGQSSACAQSETINRNTLNTLAHITINRVHRGMSGIKALKASFKKSCRGMPWNFMQTTNFLKKG